jgi:pimeloyl-ACP methyl ester carboxylesterase
LTSPLHTVRLGESGPPVAFVHGLFGQGKNFTRFAKELAADHRVTLVDLPDHGRSPRSERFDLLEYAEAVAGVLEPGTTLVGHSLGGKVAMVVALLRPDLVERLAVVDVSPVAYDHSDEFEHYISAMSALDLTVLDSRGDADEALVATVPSPTVRGFLLQSLRRDGGAWRWLLNLDLLGRDLDAITGWPADRLADLAPYDGPVLWVAGAESHYATDEQAAEMDRLFPLNRKVTVKDAGHWVHSEQPEVFLEVLRRFLPDGGVGGF